MFTITLSMLKQDIKAAKALNEPQEFSAKLRNKKRDISIVVTYHPFKNVEEDIYPYWELDLKEEESTKKLWLTDIKEVKDIYNGFCASANYEESYIDKYLTVR